VTNPPYSGEHKIKLCNYLHQCGKPFALLLPVYIVTKSYWKSFLTSYGSDETITVMKSMTYLIPSIHYEYSHPDGTGKEESPFFSVWFIGGITIEDHQRYVRLLMFHIIEKHKTQ
jgi:hypothetical protein